MRILVTGAMNPHGQAIIHQLAEAGHFVRAFGVPAGTSPFDHENVKSFPGDVTVGGSIEPVLAEREVLIHAAALDAPGKDKQHHARVVKMGGLYARYAAEREQVNAFVYLAHPNPGKVFGQVHQEAREDAEVARGILHTRVVDALDTPEATAKNVADLLASLPNLGNIVGGNDNAVTA